MQVCFQRCWSSSITLLAMWAASLLLSGCAMLQGQPDRDLADSELRSETRGTYLVELRTGREPDVKKMELVGTPTLNDALEQAGVNKKMGKLNIQVIRTIPGTNRRHKMDVAYEPKMRGVPHEQNYQLHPNDHIVVEKKVESPLQDFIPATLGGFGGR